MTYTEGYYWSPTLQHAAYLALGIVMTWVISMLPYRYFKIILPIGLFISIPLLIYAFFSGAVNDASRWINLGLFSFQPSEVAKVCLVGFSAFMLSAPILRDEKGANKTAFKIVFTAMTIILMLIITENLSTAGIIFMVIMCILFYAKAPMKYMIRITGALILLGGIGLAVVFMIPDSALESMKNSDGAMHRVPTWINRVKGGHDMPADPKEYNLTENVQVTHAQIAIATCNIVGKGPGNSVERDYLPQAFSDFIYAIIMEEGGIIAGTLVMFLYLLLLYRAIRISQRCKALFPTYLVMGLALMIVVQALVNMAVAVGVIPVTGQPLPLISRGGTSTFVNCAYIGMILSVSHTAKMEEENSSEEKEKTEE